MYKFLIKAGHGKHTPGKRSPDTSIGIMEWEFNRLVAEELELFSTCDIEFLNPGPVEIPLKAAKKHINCEAAKDSNIVAVMIHANAAGKGGWSTGSGSRIFVPKYRWKRTKALRKKEHERIAKSRLFGEHLTNVFTDNPSIPYSARPMIAKNFKMLTVDCPAVLIECGFMTNKKDAAFMRSVCGPSIISTTIARGMASFISAMESV